MRYFLEKLLQDLLLSPLGWSIWLFLMALFFIRRKNTDRAKRCLWAGLAVLFFFSSPWIASFLGFPLEYKFPMRSFGDYPPSQAIVVLGGSVVGPIPPRLYIEELAGARVLGAARLFRAGKAPLVVVSSGDPYVASDGSVRQEAQDMKDLLIEYGVPSDAILVETNSRTTLENAQRTAQLLGAKGIKEILLVTSAFHIYRAVTLFEKAGLTVIPVPTSCEVTAGSRAVDFFPKASGLAKSTLYLKEYFGRLLGR